MECLKCGNEIHEVINTERSITVDGKRSPINDVRVYRCRVDKGGCGLVTYVDCKVARVEVFSKRRIKALAVTVEEYKEKWRDKELGQEDEQDNTLFDDKQ